MAARHWQLGWHPGSAPAHPLPTAQLPWGQSRVAVRPVPAPASQRIWLPPRRLGGRMGPCPCLTQAVLRVSYTPDV